MPGEELLKENYKPNYKHTREEASLEIRKEGEGERCRGDVISV